MACERNESRYPRPIAAFGAATCIVIIAIGGGCGRETPPNTPIAMMMQEPPSPVSVASRVVGDQQAPSTMARRGAIVNSDKPARDQINPRLLRRFRPVATEGIVSVPPSAAMVDLGRMLWYEKRLSKDATINCDSCHALERYGVDGLGKSVGEGGQLARRNSPTVYNVSEHFVFFWDGRAPSAAAQAVDPILGVTEMASSRERVEAFLAATPEYKTRFAQAFPETPTPSLEHVATSLAAFEAGLTTRSRWDDYLDGDEAALSDDEVHGLRVFLDVGCMTCHTGPQVGASSFQKAGAVEPWPNQDDLGRFEITHDPADRMMFKVPTLKNVARTRPYFHDGSTASLAEAVARMGHHQLGITLEPAEVEAIVHFLEAMTGELPRDYIARPRLPGES